jgi:vacuolar-type H+-ATPase subunit I/STV1
MATAEVEEICDVIVAVLLLLLLLLLFLAPQPSLGLGLLHKIRLNFLEASQQFSFFTGKGC